MITVDKAPPIFYIGGEELKRYADDPTLAEVEGVAYEWEGENVFHLHFSPINHSFGYRHNVHFSKSEITNGEQHTQHILVHVISSESVYVLYNGQKIEVSIIPAKADLYSRNKGLLELNILENKRVMIVGLGSFGSQISIEFAKAGVGHFALMDFDRVELHNLSRHTAVTHDLGRLKTNVLTDAIMGKNPYASVEQFPIDINDYPDLLIEQCSKADIVICATDNNRSRFNLSEALVKTGKTGILGRAITRAEGGDVFIYRPGGPCYCCLIGNGWYNASIEEITNEESARRDGKIAAYVSAKDADAMIQVGLSTDIEPMCNMMVKLALIELSRGTSSGISSLEDEFVYSYYIWANRRERNYTNWASFANPGQLPTIMRWYGVDIERDEGCALCGNVTNLDTGENFMNEFGDSIGNVIVDKSFDIDKFKDEH